MMKDEVVAYYQTNAVYEKLIEYDATDFVWTSGNAWILLYGNSQSQVKAIIFVLGKTTESLKGDELNRLKNAEKFALDLAERASVKFATIVFDDTIKEISEVTLNSELVSLEHLTGWFEDAGLSVRQGVTGKAINDASSSAYHNWQRQYLGAIRVSDIDLIYAPTGKVSTICELKRSYITLDRWSPFSADFANFDLVKDLCSKANVEFRIIYNVRHKAPKVFDDASRISIYKYSASTGPVITRQLDFEEFISGADLV
jgi:hypothetical protein